MLLVALAFAIPRETVLDEAARYTTHAWTATSANTTEVWCADDWESDYAPGTYVGLPYDWGGWVTLDEFDAQIADGYGAGSHSWHGVLSCTTGVDCSGFVSQLWDSGHYSTSTFDEVADDIGWEELERGDALNDPGSHMVLYTHQSEAGWPVFYESAGSSGVRLNSSAGWSYVDGYQPIRYRGIEDGAATGTAGTPIEILAFPFEDTRWTAGAASDRLDGYACAPDTEEGGPEVLYRFVALTAGRLEAVVSDASGVDVDIHVLTAPEADACVARDDTEVSLEVGPGEVWLSLDTWVGSSQEYPGPYLLTVTFDGEVGTADPGDTGSPPDDDPPDDDPPDDTAPDDAAGAGGVGGGAAEVIPAERPEARGGCGCAAAADGRGAWVALGAGLLGVLRRRRR